MTRPDAERALAYLQGTYNEGITYCNPGEERRNQLTGWVDSDLLLVYFNYEQI